MLKLGLKLRLEPSNPIGAQSFDGEYFTDDVQNTEYFTDDAQTNPLKTKD